MNCSPIDFHNYGTFCNRFTTDPSSAAVVSSEQLQQVDGKLILSLYISIVLHMLPIYDVWYTQPKQHITVYLTLDNNFPVK